MKTINVTKLKSSHLTPSFSSVSSISIEDSSFGSGAFAEVYKSKKIDGKVLSMPQGVKIFYDLNSAKKCIETIKQLQDEIVKYNKQLKSTKERKPIEDVSALQALPQFTFEGNLNGKTVVGYSANYLDKNEGWVLFDKIANGDEDDIKNQFIERSKFYKLPPAIRLKMVHSLAEGFSYLRCMNFIHADLNPKNFFVNANNGQICLIDYDGGAVMDARGRAPVTYGKPAEPEWLAPEILNQLMSSSKAAQTVDLHTDTWAVAMGIHFLLVRPYHPFFYIASAKGGYKERGISTESEYLKNYQWPNVNKNYKDYIKEYNHTGAYNQYLRILSKIPDGIKKAMSATFNEGHSDPDRRASYNQWLRAIEAQMPQQAQAIQNNPSTKPVKASKSKQPSSPSTSPAKDPKLVKLFDAIGMFSSLTQDQADDFIQKLMAFYNGNKTTAKREFDSFCLTTGIKIIPTVQPPKPVTPPQPTFPAQTTSGIESVTGLANKLTWLQTNAQSNGSYVIDLSADESIDPQTLSYSGKSGITITLRGIGSIRTISLLSNGSLFTIESGVTLILEKVMLLGHGSDNEAYLVNINSGGTLIMNTGTCISGNTYYYPSFFSKQKIYYDKGVSVSTGGSFNMTGGKITGGTVDVKGSFTISGGEISHSGVSVPTGGYFTMSGGEISGNSHYVSVYGSCSVSVKGSFIMANGKISGSLGVGVEVDVDGSFLMTGGEISGNLGGGVVVRGGSFTMTNGTILGNTTPFYGGGVLVDEGSFTMKGGEISGNTAKYYGGGVCVYARNTYSTGGTFKGVAFTKTGGTVYGYNESKTKRNRVKSINGGHAVHVLLRDSASGNNIAMRRGKTSGPGDILDSAKADKAGGWGIFG